MNKENKTAILIILIIIQIPLILFLSESNTTGFDIDFYENEFQKYNPNVSNPINITQNLLDFLGSKELDESYLNKFTEQEISHLQDVKKLNHRSLLFLSGMMAFIAICIFLLFEINKKYSKKNLGISFIGGGILTLILTTISPFLINNFQKVFIKFHLLLFPQGNWQFSETSLLIRLFPEQFWIDITQKIVIKVIISANILILIGILLILINKNGGIKNVIHKFQNIPRSNRRKRNKTSKNS